MSATWASKQKGMHQPIMFQQLEFNSIPRKNPEVREAAEKALITLRTMRGLMRCFGINEFYILESYVSEVMRGSGSNTPKIAKFRSAEVSAAYILACERVDANPKLVQLKNLFSLIFC
jgi:hypothetical protein